MYGINASDQIQELGSNSSFLTELANLLPFYRCSIEHPDLGDCWEWKWSTMANLQLLRHIDRYITQAFCANTNESFGRLPKVILFIWLLINDRILTQAVMAEKGFHVTTGCVLCQETQDTDIETRDHLLWSCTLASRFLRGLAAHMNVLFMRGAQTVTEAWWDIRSNILAEDRRMTGTVWVARCWALWRERNRRTFSNERKSLSVVIHDTVVEIQRWMEFC